MKRKIESVMDFKERIAAMMRERERTFEKCLKIAKADRPCVRTPADRGYYPPERKR